MNRRNPRFSELVRQGLIIFFLRRRVVLGIFACTVAITAIASLTLVPQYRASAAFLITGFELNNDRNLPGTPNNIGQGLHSQMLVTNEIRILKSTDVAGNALTALRERYDSGDFYASRVSLPGPIQALRRAPGRLLAGLGAWFGDDAAPAPEASSDGRPAASTRDPLVGRVLSMVDIRPARDTGVIEVSVEHSDPSFAMDTVQAYLDAYLDQRRKLGQTEGATEFYREEADRHWQQWTALNDSIQKLKAELGVVDPTSERSTVVGQVNSVSAELETLRVARDELTRTAERLGTLSGARVASLQLPAGLTDPVLSQLLQRAGELEATRADRLRSFAPESSMVRSVDDELGVVRSRIAQVSRALIEDEVQRYEARIGILEGKQGEQRSRAAELEKAASEIERLTEQASLAQEQVRAYERKYSETETDRMLRERTMPNIGIVAQASVSPNPVFPNRPLLVGASAVLGLFMGMLIAFVQEMLDDSLKLPDQVAQEFDIPVLGTFELEGIASGTVRRPAVGALGSGL